METLYALLADYANLSQEGKLNVLGIFGKLVATKVPCTHPQLYLVLRFRATPGEKGSERRLQVKLVDEDGRVTQTLPPIPLQIPADSPGIFAEVNAILQLNGLTFDRFGSYQFEVLIDGDTKAVIPFVVEPAQPEPVAGRE